MVGVKSLGRWEQRNNRPETPRGIRGLQNIVYVSNEIYAKNHSNLITLIDGVLSCIYMNWNVKRAKWKSSVLTLFGEWRECSNAKRDDHRFGFLNAPVFSVAKHYISIIPYRHFNCNFSCSIYRLASSTK